jgi:hypothetical protein
MVSTPDSSCSRVFLPATLSTVFSAIPRALEATKEVVLGNAGAWEDGNPYGVVVEGPDMCANTQAQGKNYETEDRISSDQLTGWHSRIT